MEPHVNYTYCGIMAVFWMTLLPTPLLAQTNPGEWACNASVQIILGPSCSRNITADMVLKGNQIDNQAFTVVVDYLDGNKERDRLSRSGTFGYEVFAVTDDGMGEQICRGFLNADDKTAPAYDKTIRDAYVVCTDIDSLLKYSEQDRIRNPNTCLFSGKTWKILEDQSAFFVNQIEDNCSDKCALKFQVSDQLIRGDVCEEGTMLIRTITVSDEKGNTSEFILRFIARQMKLHFDEIADVEVDLCTFPDAPNQNYLKEGGLPFWYSACTDENGRPTKEYLDERFFKGANTASVCGLAIFFEDEVNDRDCGGAHIRRSWYYRNWCESQEMLQQGPEQLIQSAYQSPPSLQCPSPHTDEWVVSTGAFDCTAVLNIPPPQIEGCKAEEATYSVIFFSYLPKTDQFGVPIKDASGAIVYERVRSDFPLSGNTEEGFRVSAVPVGRHEVGYYVSTGCSLTTDSLFCSFEVKDLSLPIPSCRDELHLSLGGGGLAKITAEDVDRGSWDNCELESLEIRRRLDDCLDAYLKTVLNVESLEELEKETYTDGYGREAIRWFRYIDTRKTILIARETDDDGGRHFYSWWDDQSWMLCCDLAENQDDYKRIELRAVDKAGNLNICWTRVLVENKKIPQCIAPRDTLLYCTDLDFNPADLAQVRSVFGTTDELLISGQLEVIYNCDYNFSDTIQWIPGDCSEGELQRIFTVSTSSEDGVKTSGCRQKIAVKRVNDYVIQFPADEEANCSTAGGEDLQVASYACDVFAIHRDTSLFEASGEDCFKRYVTYRVINWCEYNGVSLEPSIVPRDLDCDGLLGEKTWVKVYQGNAWVDDDASIAFPGAIDVVDNEFIHSWSAEAESYSFPACNGRGYSYTKGYWEYTQVIKVYDDEAPEVLFEPDSLQFCARGSVVNLSCKASINIPFVVVDSCTEMVEVRSVFLALNGKDPTNLTGELYSIEKKGEGLFNLFNLSNTGIPVGDHLFYVRVADDCGNIANRIIPFAVVDCTSPAPICVRTLTVDLTPVIENEEVVGGVSTVWASDFIASDIFDCSPHPEADGKGVVKYYLTKDRLPSSLDSITLDENRSVTFTCEDQPLVPVFVIAVDGKDNWDYCALMVRVNPGSDPYPCEDTSVPSVTIAGMITNERQQPVENVQVNLSGQQDRSMATGPDGRYAFSGLDLGGDHTITPLKDDDQMNGVTTFDIVMMSKHILGAELLESPYQVIAGDINRSGALTTLDIIQLRKLILNVDTDFANNRSWRFLDGAYTFPDPRDPWREPLPEIISLNNLNESRDRVDFIGIKIGDVNLSSLPHSVREAPGKEKDVFDLKARTEKIEGTNTFQLDISSQGLENIEGLQFTLSFDPDHLILEDVNYGLAQKAHLGLTKIGEGLLTLSWNWPFQPGAMVTSDRLVGLVFRKNGFRANGQDLHLTSRLIPAEAYRLKEEVMGVRLDFDPKNGKEVPFGDQLYQNYPNPFVQSTNIEFSLEKKGEVFLSIQDINGRIIQVIKGHYGAGLHRITLKKLPKGMWSYTFKTGDYTATKRMLKL